MQTNIKPAPNMIMWIAGIAVTLFCAAGIAAIMGWIPDSMSRSVDAPAIVPPATSTPVAPRAPAPKFNDADQRTPVPRVTPMAAPRAAPMVEPRAAPVALATPPAVHPKCAECGVVESTREVAVKGEGSGIGAVGGAVVGGLLGNQVGGGRGKDVATVIGAVGGVVAGNEIEKRVKTTNAYEVTVRLDDGSTRVVREASAPTWRAGDHVKLVDGAIRAN